MDVNQRFVEYFRLRPAPATKPSARPGAAALKEDEAAAERLSSATPPSFLSEEQAADFAARRTPQLGEILHQCALGLSGSPGFSATVPVTAAICENLVQGDEATTQLIKATGDVYEAASTGVLLTAGEASDLGARVLQAAAERAEDGDYELRLRFVQALTQFTKATERRQGKRGQAEAAVAPSRAQADRAQAQADEARALMDFHRKHNQ